MATPISSVRTATWLADLIILLREEINENITDPITRSGNSRLCLSAYPKRTVQYPIVTVVDRGMTDWRKGGMQSTVTIQKITIEIRVWGRNVVERDELTDSITDRLRTRLNTFSITEKIHNLRMGSMVNVDEPGEAGIHSKIINVDADVILGE